MTREDDKALLSVRMLASDLARLREVAARQDRTLSDVVRRALRRLVLRAPRPGDGGGEHGRASA